MNACFLSRAWRVLRHAPSIFSTLTAVILATVATVAAAGGPSSSARENGEGAMTPVQRGEYLVTVAGCHDCHTPLKMGPKGPEPDMSRQLSGHPADLTMPPPPALGHGPWGWAGSLTMTAFVGPWGVSYAANLTPDPQTGLGALDENVFTMAMRNGKHFGVGRPLLPPMPWMNVAKMSDADLKAVYAYLRSIPPIKNQVPEPVIAGPPPGAGSHG